MNIRYLSVITHSSITCDYSSPTLFCSNNISNNNNNRNNNNRDNNNNNLFNTNNINDVKRRRKAFSFAQDDYDYDFEDKTSDGLVTCPDPKFRPRMNATNPWSKTGFMQLRQPGPCRRSGLEVMHLWMEDMFVQRPSCVLKILCDISDMVSFTKVSTICDRIVEETTCPF